MKIITLQGKEYRGEIIRKGNDSRNLNIYQVRLEDGRVGMVHEDNIREEKIKVTGKIEQEKFESFDMFGDREDRVLAFFTTLSAKNGSLEDLEKIFDQIVKYMEKELDVEFARCPFEEEYDGVVKYGDSFHIEYAYGDMKEAKKEVMTVWKEAKKIFC